MTDTDYVPVRDQLVVELYVRSIAASRAFYERFGFRVTLDKGSYPELAWGDAWIMLDELAVAPVPAGRQHPRHGARRRSLLGAGARARRPGDPPAGRDYGLRDFSMAGPDGLGLRFATWLPPGSELAP